MALALVLPASGKSLRIETIASVPFGFIDTDGNPTGIMYEISNRIAEEAGLPYTNKIIPYARTVLNLESGACDFVLRYTNDQLPGVAIPVATIVSLPTIILGKKGSYFKSLADLHGKTVGAPRGGRFDDGFDADTHINKVETNDYVEISRMLVAGRIDAGIGSNIGMYFSAQSAGIRPAELGTPLVLSSKDFILHFSRKTADPQTVQALKSAVDRLQKQGEIRKIIQKYVGDYPWEATKPAK